MVGYPNLVDFSALQFDDEEGKQGAEEEIRAWQEIACPNLACVVMEEGGAGTAAGSAGDGSAAGDVYDDRSRGAEPAELGRVARVGLVENIDATGDEIV